MDKAQEDDEVIEDSALEALVMRLARETMSTEKPRKPFGYCDMVSIGNARSSST